MPQRRLEAARQCLEQLGPCPCRGVQVSTPPHFSQGLIGRLHEVLSRAATLNNGVSPAGLGPVNQPGVQDIDVSEVLGGHMELQAKMPEIIRIIDVDS